MRLPHALAVLETLEEAAPLRPLRALAVLQREPVPRERVAPVLEASCPLEREPPPPRVPANEEPV